ncbi:MAG TPA: hypothetical protein VHH73_13115 [Verrucomicrobiae bacterium]|nr:hypothetical protein [Verrucomicrobiae bacterium]
MNVIQANCRTRFTATDVEFIVSVLGPKVGQADCLVKLLADEQTRDLILDDEALLHALLEHRGCLQVSSHFYFYVLVRQVFRRAGIESRAVADYVAEVLAEFSRADRAACRLPGQSHPLEYFFEILAAMQNATEAARFSLEAHIGNHALFLAGVFCARIQHRWETRGFPNLRYYEDLGRAHYHAASEHRLARKYCLSEIFAVLAERFQAIRKALNDLADRLVSLSDIDSTAHLILPRSAGA